jgi:general stress protein 26
MTKPERTTVIEIMNAGAGRAHLATCDGDQPMVRAVAPHVGDDLTIWVATFASSRKVSQIGANPKVSVAFLDPSGDVRTATAIGDATIVDDPDERKRRWGLFGYDLSGFFPEGPDSKEYCLLKIAPRKIEWRDGPGALDVLEP